MYRLQNNLHSDWHDLLQDEFKKPYFKTLEKFLVAENKKGKIIFPDQKDVFQCFNRTPFSRVKVVILGQDPYHGDAQANGLSFSVHSQIPIPPSLKNIFKELSHDLDMEIPENGNLEKWAEQGVLLLNTVLTVEKSLAHSHRKKGWEEFTDKIIKLLNDNKSNLVFILWGEPAKKKGRNIDKTKHHIIHSSHPSPLSSYRGFFGSKPFSKANAYLKSHKNSEVSWKL